MYRYEIINSLIEKYEFKKYLEIGVFDPNLCYNLINCEIKHSVDPMFERYEESIDFKYTSDVFFNYLENGKLNLPNNYKWDIIFIDGDHISTQVFKDVKNALNHISENGFIILHDCNPPNIFRAREDYMIDDVDPEWNGTVWKVIYNLRSTRPDLLIYTIDTDEGIGLITKGNQICCDFDNIFYEYRMFETNKKDYLNLISVDEFKEKFLNKMENKNIFIIDTYPSTEEQKKLLVNCINRLSNIGFDIMIVSHLPIPENIQKLATYYIYDSDNTFLPTEKTPFFWVSLLNNIFRVFNSGHSLAITRNMQNALLMSKSAGYDFFYFLEYDVLVDESDIDKLLNLRTVMKNEGKKMIFFEPENFYESGSHVYETLLFGGEVDYFLSKFLPPKNIQEWDSLGMGYTLELAFYEQLSKYSEDFLIVPEHSSDFLSNSDVNLYRYGLMINELLYNYNNPNRPILLLYKLFHNQQDYEIKVYHNDSMIYETVMCKGCWWFREFELDNSNLKIEIYLHGELQEIKNYKLNTELLDKIILKGDVKSEL